MTKFLILIWALLLSGSLLANDADIAELIKDVLGDSDVSASDNYSEVRFLLRPQRSAVLSAKIDGQITKLALVEGKKFKKGDTLVKIDCALQEAELDFNKAEESSVQYTFNTNKVLRRSNSVGKLEYVKSEQEFKKAKARVDSSEATVDKCEIKAPYSGQVAKVFNKQYQYVQLGQELVEIFDDTVFEMKMLIPSSWLKWLKEGHVFTARLDETGEEFKAEIKRISPKIDSVSKTVPITAVLVDEPKLRLYGMSGVALIAPDNPDNAK